MQVNATAGRHCETLGQRAKFPDMRTPFDFYIFESLLDEKSFESLKQVPTESISLSLKNNDLYKFKQSEDLRSETLAKPLACAKILDNFAASLLVQVRPRLEELSGLKLSETEFDITASRYDTGDYLLCHNDDIKDEARQRARALAFIFYLNSRPWTSEDGGALILYDSDKRGEPISENNHVYPRPNDLVVFKTSATSWHSVQEVFCQGETRPSINGWFHLANPPTASSSTTDPNSSNKSGRKTESCPSEILRPQPLDERIHKFFAECINGEYLMERTCLMVRRQFKRESEINLSNFLVAEKYKEICEALREAAKEDANLEHVGPYNKRNYRRFKVNELPPICRDLFDAFHSELFFILLARLTGLDLQPIELGASERETSEDEHEEDEEESDGQDSEDGGEEELEEDESEADADENEVEFSEQVGSQEEAAEKDEPEPEASERRTGVSGEQGKQAKEDSHRRPRKKTKRPRDPVSRLELRHLEAGSYTLLHDHAFELAENSALDVMLHFNHDFEVNLEQGGYISYMDVSGEPDGGEEATEEGTGSGEDLLTVEPESNTLSLVYRSDGSTARFLKYITRAHKSSYQDLSCVFYERPEDLPGPAERPCSRPSINREQPEEGSPTRPTKRAKTEEGS